MLYATKRTKKHKYDKSKQLSCVKHLVLAQGTFISALVVTEHKMRALLTSVLEGSITNDEFVLFISTSKEKKKLRLTFLE